MRKKQAVFLGAAMLLTACAKNPTDVFVGTVAQNMSKEQETTLTQDETEKNVSDNDAPVQDMSQRELSDSDLSGKNVSANDIASNMADKVDSSEEQDPETEERSLGEMTVKETKEEQSQIETTESENAVTGDSATTKLNGDGTSVENTTIEVVTTAETTEALVTELSTTEMSTTSVPITAASTTAVQTTEAPTTEAPTTEAPTTEAPTTEAPTTEAPTTVAPTTEASTTAVPTTAAPVTEAAATAEASTLVKLECTYMETAYTGDTFDQNKLSVKAVYSDGTSETVTGWSSNDFVFQQGVNDLTVVYGCFTQYTYLMAVDRPVEVSASTFVNGHHVYVQDYDTLGKNYYQQYIEEINKQLQQINFYRQTAGVSELVLDQTLCDVAGYRIAEMELENFYSHNHMIGESDTGVLCMTEVAPLYGVTVSAENISQGYGAISTSTLGTMFAEAFYNSDRHRANMENAAYTKIGIAISYDGNTFRCVQVFQ